MIHSTGRAIFWRLFWKEYRVQRAFWLCIAVLAVVLMALPAITVVNSVDRLHWRFAIARYCPHCLRPPAGRCSLPPSVRRALTTSSDRCR